MDDWTKCKIDIRIARILLQRTPNQKERTKQLCCIMKRLRIQKEITDNTSNN